VSVLVSLTLLLAIPASASATTLLRANSIGPLSMGMTRADAVATGWIAGKQLGCELAGPNRGTTYRFTGPKAPSGLVGTVDFSKAGRLVNISTSRGARTAVGVVVNVSTVKQMVAKYRNAGYKATARFDDVFQGTFVNISKNGKLKFQGFADKSVIGALAVPNLPLCE